MILRILFLFLMLFAAQSQAWRLDERNNSSIKTWTLVLDDSDTEMKKHIDAFVALFPKKSAQNLPTQKEVESNLMQASFRMGFPSKKPNLPKDFWPKIEPLVFLKRINLSHCNIETLPESIEKLTALEWLDLSYTPITELSQSIGKLSFLQRLNLSSTQIATLPESIGNLRALQGLSLQDNTSLTTLPRTLLNLAPKRVLTGLVLGNAPIAPVGDALSLAQLRAAFGDRVFHNSFNKKYEAVKEESIDSVLATYNAQSPRLNLDVFKTLKLAVVKESTLDYAAVENLFWTIAHKMHLSDETNPAYLSANMVEEYLIVQNSEASVEAIYQTVLHKFRSLWGALNQGEKTAWIFTNPADIIDYKNKIVFVLETLQDKSGADALAPFAQLLKGVAYCPHGQKGALDTLTNGFLGLSAGSAETPDALIKKLVASLKENLAVYTFAPADNQQSVHLMDFYKTNLDGYLGFSNFSPTADESIEWIQQATTDPYGFYPGNALKAYLQRLAPSWIAKKLMENVGYYFDQTTKGRPLQFTDLLTWLESTQKIKAVMSENDTDEMTTYEGSEHYFDNQRVEKIEKNSTALNYPETRLTQAGALQILTDLGIVIKNETPPGVMVMEG